MRLLGLHHVTAICSDLERTTAFYRDLLGLALVREGVNDDDPDARHFWFGDAQGTPGTLVSFMEYPATFHRKCRAPITVRLCPQSRQWRCHGLRAGWVRVSPDGAGIPAFPGERHEKDH